MEKVEKRGKIWNNSRNPEYFSKIPDVMLEITLVPLKSLPLPSRSAWIESSQHLPAAGVEDSRSRSKSTHAVAPYYDFYTVS